MLEHNINEILRTYKEVTIGLKGGVYYAVTDGVQGDALSIHAALERLLIKLTQQEETRKLGC